jgi:hypothetical protein
MAIPTTDDLLASPETLRAWLGPCYQGWLRDRRQLSPLVVKELRDLQAAAADYLLAKGLVRHPGREASREEVLDRYEHPEGWQPSPDKGVPEDEDDQDRGAGRDDDEEGVLTPAVRRELEELLGLLRSWLRRRAARGDG